MGADDVTCYDPADAEWSDPRTPEQRAQALDSYVARNDTPECSESWGKHMVTIDAQAEAAANDQHYLGTLIDAPAVHAKLMAEERRYRTEWLANLPRSRLLRRLAEGGLPEGYAQLSVDVVMCWLMEESERG